MHDGLRRGYLFTLHHAEIHLAAPPTVTASCVAAMAGYPGRVTLESKRWIGQQLGLCGMASLALACSGTPSETSAPLPPPSSSSAITSSDSTPSGAPSSPSGAPSATIGAAGSTSNATPSPTLPPPASEDATSNGTSTEPDRSTAGAAFTGDDAITEPVASSGGPEESSGVTSDEPSASTTGGAASEVPTSGDDCPHQGNVSYSFNNPESWPAEVVDKLTAALDEAVYYYNCYSDLTKDLHINYKPDVPTAEGNVDGWISFGSDRNYMVTATAMHEIGHTLGVGYAPWSELIQDGRWVGPAVVEFISNLPTEQRDPDMYSQRTYITCDNQHFWPYGLNQASEHQSEWSLINHVKIVAAMNADKDAVR